VAIIHVSLRSDDLPVKLGSSISEGLLDSLNPVFRLKHPTASDRCASIRTGFERSRAVFCPPNRVTFEIENASGEVLNFGSCNPDLSADQLRKLSSALLRLASRGPLGSDLPKLDAPKGTNPN